MPAARFIGEAADGIGMRACRDATVLNPARRHSMSTDDNQS
jgi:hypothetical protein